MRLKLDVILKPYNRSIFVFVGVRLHIPNYLVGKQLGELGSLDDIPLDIA